MRLSLFDDATSDANDVFHVTFDVRESFVEFLREEAKVGIPLRTLSLHLPNNAPIDYGRHRDRPSGSPGCACFAPPLAEFDAFSRISARNRMVFEIVGTCSVIGRIDSEEEEQDRFQMFIKQSLYLEEPSLHSSSVLKNLSFLMTEK